ncbi:MAG: hypothetical protein R6U96_15080 [Promethearchaeia archaeon]
MISQDLEPPVWRLKYLPESLDEICGREDLITRLEDIIKRKNFPHMLFIGSEGIGKTTIARLFAKEFLGRYYDANFKLVYADEPLTSEERRTARSESYISTSRIGSTAGKKMRMPAFLQIKIKPFVELKALGGADFKILIVKNFETLGSNQEGFRRLMETYGNNCRMILISTKISGIIDPILSRCQLMLVPQPSYKSFDQLINKIAAKESLKVEEEIIKTLYQISEGKLAKAIDLLQLCSLSGNTVTLDKLQSYLKEYRNKEIRKLLKICLQGNFKDAREQLRDIISEYKYNPHELFSMLLDEVDKSPISRFVQTQLIEMISKADFKAVDGNDDDIQMSALIANICKFSEYI